jgi:hypothetical protein
MPIVRYTNLNPQTLRYEKDDAVECDLTYMVLDRAQCQQLARCGADGTAGYGLDLVAWCDQAMGVDIYVRATTPAWKRHVENVAKIETLAPQHEADLMGKAERSGLPLVVSDDLAAAGRYYQPLTIEQAEQNHAFSNFFNHIPAEQSKRQKMLAQLADRFWESERASWLDAGPDENTGPASFQTQLAGIGEELSAWKKTLARLPEKTLVADDSLVDEQGRTSVGIIYTDGRVCYIDSSGEVQNQTPYDLRLRYALRHADGMDPDSTELQAHWILQDETGTKDYYYVFSVPFASNENLDEVEDS